MSKSAIGFKNSGSFSNTFSFFKRMSQKEIDKILAEYGEQGVRNLEYYTPKRTGLTSRSWTYRIEHQNGKTLLLWDNTNIQNGMNIALLIDFGHATPSGTWVEGKEYIDPAIQSVFLQALDDKWKELKRL